MLDDALTIKRQTRSMPVFRFILGMVLACHIGFSRLNHLRFLQREPMLTGILRVAELLTSRLLQAAVDARGATIRRH